MKKIKKALVFLMAFMLIAAAFPTMALAADGDLEPVDVDAPADDITPVEDTQEPAAEEPIAEESAAQEDSDINLLAEGDPEPSPEPSPSASPAPSYAAPTIKSITAASGKILGQNTSDLYSDLTFSVTGTSSPYTIKVAGTLNGITGWTQFSSVEEYQSGYYFAMVTTPGADTTIKLVAPVNGGPVDTNDDTSVVRIASIPSNATTFQLEAYNPGETNKITYNIDLSGVKLQPGTIEDVSAVINSGWQNADKIVVTAPSGLGTLSTTKFVVKNGNKTVTLAEADLTYGTPNSNAYTITLPQPAVNGEKYTVQIVTDYQQSDVIPVTNEQEPLSKTKLEGLIADAKENSDGILLAPASVTAPTDVPEGTKFVMNGDATAYNNLLDPLKSGLTTPVTVADPSNPTELTTVSAGGALAYAEFIDGYANATQAQIDAAYNYLDTALTAFVGKVDVGTGTNVETPDLTKLEEAIAAAEEAMADVKTGSTPKKAAEVVMGTKYLDTTTNSTEYGNYTSALNAAKAIVNAGGIGETNTTVATALDNLNSAVKALTPLIVNGTKDVDYAPLQEAIENAKAVASELVESANGSDIYEDDEWVPEGTIATLNAAIAAAEDHIKDDDLLYKSQVDAEVETLNKAVAAAQKLAKPGKLTRPAIEPVEDAPNPDIAVGPNDKLEDPAVTGLDAPAQGEAVPSTNTASEFLQNFAAPDGYTMELRDEDDNAVVGDATICTGMILAIVDSNGDTVSEAIVIVKGDTAGNGCVSLLGAGRLARFVMGNDDALTAPQQAAGDMNGDGQLSLLDFGQMARIILATRN